ncbi:MAG: serine/threonine protein kinase [Polyangiaceae bacterium]|nr:serine/threonine protein kinase [Polyangiaceae bacterium]MCE7888497.1 serine/threonine protein kinase [Sorangiineae bacterium PRO1]MCL4751486.1 protein kinase [Myxococcales bacterium]
MSPAAAAKRPFPPGMPVTAGDVIAGKYRVEELVAVGGMGVVVSAKHLQLGQQVAIKVLLPVEVDDDSQAAIPRFLREARAAAGLKSEHVVRIYDVDTLESGLPYMVMELLSGQDLRRVVKTGGPLPVEQAVDFVLQAADAIGEAHGAGIVHRDLKPSNLFLTQRNDGRPWVKVLDFGISKASHDPLLEGTLTTSRAMIGSPMYMSPEQVRDAKSVDGRSDIWSLGVILHELLSGKPAFRGESLPAICAAIAADQPQSLSEARPDVPPELVAIVSRCLEKDPALRYQSVAELRAVLLPFLGHYAPTVPVSAGGPTSARFGYEAVAVPGSLRTPQPASARVPLGSSGSVDVAGGLLGTGSSPREKMETDPTQRYQRSAPDARTMNYADAVRTASSAHAASDAPFAATGMAAPRRSRLPLVIGGGVALVLSVGLAVGVGSLGSSGKGAASAATPAPAPAPSFSLTLESEPPGAEVLEGDRVLGKTPLSLPVERASVKTAPRSFSLRLAGHQPYRVEQGDSATDVKVRAPLVAEAAAPEPSAEAEPAPSATAKPAGRTHAGAGKPSTQKPAPDTAGKPSTDIRLSR